jgi:hypothetical protein
MRYTLKTKENYPNYYDLSIPDHKHTLNEVIESVEPDLNQILKEVKNIILFKSL